MTRNMLTLIVAVRGKMGSGAQALRLVGRAAKLLAGVAAFTASLPSYAQSGDAAGAVATVIDAIGQLAGQGRFQKDVSAMSSPLQFESSNGPLDPGNLADPRNFDVAGIRLGMTPAEVRQALAASGYKVTNVGEQNSFDTEVRKQVAFTSTFKWINVPLFIKAEGRNQQTLSVDFVALPEGPKTSKIEYSMGSPDMSSEAFAGQISRKYGAASADDSGTLQVWCAGGEECFRRDHAYMLVDVDAKTITLEDVDSVRDEAFVARLEDEVTKRKPQIQEAQF